MSDAGFHCKSIDVDEVAVAETRPPKVGGVTSGGANVLADISTALLSILPASSIALTTKKKVVSGFRPVTLTEVAPAVVVKFGVVKFSPPEVVDI